MARTDEWKNILVSEFRKMKNEYPWLSTPKINDKPTYDYDASKDLFVYNSSGLGSFICNESYDYVSYFLNLLEKLRYNIHYVILHAQFKIPIAEGDILTKVISFNIPDERVAAYERLKKIFDKLSGEGKKDSDGLPVIWDTSWKELAKIDSKESRKELSKLMCYYFIDNLSKLLSFSKTYIQDKVTIKISTKVEDVNHEFSNQVFNLENSESYCNLFSQYLFNNIKNNSNVVSVSLEGVTYPISCSISIT